MIVAECPALPGCISQGRDEMEALQNINEAIIGWLWVEEQKVFSSIPLGEKNRPFSGLSALASCAVNNLA